MNSTFLSVVIPAYNEERRILSTLERVVGFLATQTYSWEVVVVDDGSTDATANLVEKFREGRPQVDVVRLPHRGKGWAVKHGMLTAQGEYRLLCDADLSVPIEQVRRFLPPALEDCDIAIGSREAPGARRFREPALRHFLGRVYNNLVRLMVLPSLTDTQCGFKCFRARAASQLFSLQRLSGFAFDVEVLFLAHRWGLRMVEVPVDWYYERESKVKPLRDSWVMFRDMVAIRWNQLRGRYNLRGNPAEGAAPTEEAAKREAKRKAKQSSPLDKMW